MAATRGYCGAAALSPHRTTRADRMTAFQPEPPADPQEPATFTGRARRRKTRTSVRVVDAVAKYGITVGGLAVVAALAGLILFLVAVVVPLFSNADTDEALVAGVPVGSADAAPVAMQMDDSLKAAWTLDRRGRLGVYQIDRVGNRLVPIHAEDLAGDAEVTAVAQSRTSVGLGRADGTVVVGEVRFDIEYPKERPAELAGRTYDDPPVPVGGAVGDVTRNGQSRLTRAVVDFAEPATLADGDPSADVSVTHLDYLAEEEADRNYLVARRADGRTFWALSSTRTNYRTGEKTTTLRDVELPPVAGREGAEVAAVMVGRNGENAYVLGRDGHLAWYDTKGPANNTGGPRLAGEFDVTGGDRTVTAARMLLGNFTLIVADDAGGVAGWFPAQGADGEWTIAKAHELAPQPAAVTTVALSGRDRQFLTGDADGNLWLRHMIDGTTQAKVEVGGESGRSPVTAAALAPPLNAFAAISADGTFEAWDLDNPHPDGKLPAVFLPVQYEGYGTETFVWQSSSAGDAAEPKYSIVPLVWGTLKATFYAMLFATPVAILAAIYSAEFMQPRVRSVVKPSVEMMAGLPSVVLGYIAAQVLAPYAEDVLPGMLITFAAVPISVMIFGFLWQLVPPSEVNRQAGRWALAGWGLVGLAGLLYYGGLPPALAWVAWSAVAAVLLVVVLVRGEESGPFMPFVVMGTLVIAGVLIGLSAGPLFADVLFGGDLRAWLRGAPEGWVASLWAPLQALPGWVLLLTPLFAVALVIAFNLYLRQRLGLFDGRHRTRTQLAAADLARFALTAVAAVVLAVGVGSLLSAVGLDLRDDWPGRVTGGVVKSSGFLDGFDQRNALVVGMIMGFAVIPIIYTVSEDALTAVPNTLRSAALGAGATPWQTAVRVVMPVAISGIFSACMIGLGRAVGETMIVLMAAGNTPTMNLNVFDGMRTLSANIATEMPEAPREGTLYRILFFSALVLFAMTFVVNTLAEFVRIRFRRRAFQL